MRIGRLYGSDIHERLGTMACLLYGSSHLNIYLNSQLIHNKLTWLSETLVYASYRCMQGNIRATGINIKAFRSCLIGKSLAQLEDRYSVSVAGVHRASFSMHRS